MTLRALVLLAALLGSAAAHAEAALADLIFLMPGILLAGIYQELSRPWVLGSLWGAAAFCWLVHFVTGRDAAGDWLDRFHNRDSQPLFEFSSYGAFAFWAVLCSLYVLVGSVFVGLSQPSKKSAGAHANRTVPSPREATNVLQYPHGKSPANPGGTWPSTSGPLPGLKMEAFGGNAYLMLRNPGDDALWVRVCTADLAPECMARREVYLAPRHHYLMERLAPGRYHLAYAQVTGGRRTGSSAAFRVDPATWDGMREMALTEFHARSDKR